MDSKSSLHGVARGDVYRILLMPGEFVTKFTIGTVGQATDKMRLCLVSFQSTFNQATYVYGPFTVDYCPGPVRIQNLQRGLAYVTGAADDIGLTILSLFFYGKLELCSCSHVL